MESVGGTVSRCAFSALLAHCWSIYQISCGEVECGKFDSTGSVVTFNTYECFVVAPSITEVENQIVFQIVLNCSNQLEFSHPLIDAPIHQMYNYCVYFGFLYQYVYHTNMLPTCLQFASKLKCNFIQHEKTRYLFFNPKNVFQSKIDSICTWTFFPMIFSVCVLISYFLTNNTL